MRFPRLLVVMGGDPELFLSRGDEVVGSEKVIPERGIMTNGYGSIIRDGVQVEFNLPPATCRESMGIYLATLMGTLTATLTADVGMCFKPLVEVSKEEMESLSAKSRILGCAPSLNSYNPKATIKVGEKFRKRSAGGHIHFGLKSSQTMMKRREEMVPVLDVLLGNTCVMLDTDPAQKERRKVYGRAGEYRLPSHGLEYRTLSNFWLRSYPLMSFVMGVGRTACMVGTSEDATNSLLALVKPEAIERAINDNDPSLARENFERIQPWIKESFAYGDSLYARYVPNFLKLTEKGIDSKWTEGPVKHWAERRMTLGSGWENFITNYRG